jgi:hypothetical protein
MQSSRRRPSIPHAVCTRICICSLRLARAGTKSAALHERGTRAPSSVTRPWADGMAGICVLPAHAGISSAVAAECRGRLLRATSSTTRTRTLRSFRHVAAAPVNTPPSADLGVAWECSRSRLGDYNMSVRLLVRLQPFHKGQSWSMSHSRVRKYSRARSALRLQ